VTGADFRYDAVIHSAFLTRRQWLRGCRHVDAVVAVPHKEPQLAFATGDDLTSQAFVRVLANVEPKQGRERLVCGGVSLIEKRIECSVKRLPGLFSVACTPHIRGGPKDGGDPSLYWLSQLEGCGTR
jgi:hypothetical protein